MPYSRQQARLAHRRRPLGQRLRAQWRDTQVLFREFRGLLTAFALVVLACATSFMLLWNSFTSYERLAFPEALYFVITMLFLETTIEFPGEWFLELYFFLMPVVGLIFLGLGVADFAVLLFNRKAREKEWEAAVASTFNRHIIVCGVGHLGIRVVRELVILHEDVVVIEHKPDNHRLQEVRSYDIPVIIGDAREESILEKAGLERASSVIICTNDDLINLQIVSRIREMNESIRVVMRMFEDEFGHSVAEHFNVNAVMSASALAAPAFAGAAVKTEIMHTFAVAGRVMGMGRLEVEVGSALDGSTISTLEHELDVSVIMLQSNSTMDITPSGDRVLSAGDVLHVVAELPNLRSLASRWNRRGSRP
ncbi:MAG: hypothetical protein Kow00124_15560 [Anaerolineae bacterium]